MVTPNDSEVKFAAGGSEIEPLEGYGVKLMSIGFINPTDSMVVRGARAAPLIEQLVSRTQWGELDYLIIDMPPGTSDIQLSLSQSVSIDAAVVVTTPQRISFVDVVKGVEMFDKVGIPCVAVVENMSHYTNHKLVEQVKSIASKHSLPKDAIEELVESISAPQQIFGQGHRERLASMWGIENTYSLPIDSQISNAGDSGQPFFLQQNPNPNTNPNAKSNEIFSKIASDLVSELETLQETRESRPEVAYDAQRNLVIARLQGGGEEAIAPLELRRLCRSPTNVADLVKDDVKPIDIFPMGNYAVHVLWNDGHQSLMPYTS
eukprot:CAMPEP_0197520692 /NCGR_PEP_ID=MMETSP1318-20131121/6029_1 /TAXON_ID=552666 /ORGANISM="Partenskyella glossopodia, Strain RCC365" /LENGTH=318 /DNA_ID=CAMNT_0043072385 /DNA_START=14 /DNA_END=967 /DNA_ORIENTATION=+